MKQLIVAIPVCAKDHHLARANLELCLTFNEGLVRHHAIILHDEVPADALEGIRSTAAKYFASVELHQYHYRGAPQWPQPQNFAWQTAARLIEGNPKYRELFVGWLWWEADALPLKPGWLTELRTAYVGCRKPFMGHIVDGSNHMNGVALYPIDISEHTTNCMITINSPFDMVLSRDSMPLIARANDLIAHQVKLFGGELPSEYDSVKDIKADGAVLFHGVTLKMVETSDASSAGSHYIPFAKQSDFKTGVFQLVGNTGIIYFNPSLLQTDKALFMFARRSTLVTPNHAPVRVFNSDIAIFKVASDMTATLVAIPEFENAVKYEQFEDPRAFQVNGNIFISIARWIRNRELAVKQSVYQITNTFKGFKNGVDPSFEGHVNFPEKMENCEKNWIWFVRNGKPHCVYLLNPSVVFSVDSQWRQDAIWRSDPVNLPWAFGNPRGGTNPVLVGNEYVTFFHSHRPWGETRRRYFMGALAFSAEPPFRLTRITSRPILCGSEHDHRAYGGPPCIFPCGAVLRGDEWLVTFGVNDENCGWIKIPQHELNGRLEPVDVL